MTKLYPMEVYERALARAEAAGEPGRYVYARKGVGLWQAVGRMMGAMKRSWSRPEPRSFPYWYPGMTTAEYVREFYMRNNLDKGSSGYNHGIRRGSDFCTYPASYIDMERLGNRPAPFHEPEQETQPELETA